MLIHDISEPSEKYSYIQGTCIVVAWRQHAIAIASDSLCHSGLNQHGTMCKVNAPCQDMVVGVAGVSQIYERATLRMIWDAHSVASSIFACANARNLASVKRGMQQWHVEMLRLIRENKLPPPSSSKQNEFPSLIVITKHENGFSVFRSTFEASNGGTILKIPYLVLPPLNLEIKVLKYGSGSKYILDNTDRLNLIASELERYANLKNIVEPSAASRRELELLALGFVELASDVDARLSTTGQMLTVGPPFSLTSAEVGVEGWQHNLL